MSENFSADVNCDSNSGSYEAFDIQNCRKLVEHMLNGVAYCKMHYKDGQPIDFIYLYTNPAFERLTGLKQVIGKRVSEVIPSIVDSNQQVFDVYGRISMGAEPEIFEIFIDSLQSWFSVSVYSPEPEYFVSIFDNITEHKQAKETLIESERQLRMFRHANAHAQDMLAFIDRNGRYVYVSPSLSEQIGYTETELLTLKVADVDFGFNHMRFDALIGALQNQTVPPFESQFRRKDGSIFPVEISPSLINFEGESYVCGIARNITERKLNESKLAEQTRQLLENNRQKDQFLAMLAHELRNPLAPIRNAIEIQKQKDIAPSQINWCTNIIDRQLNQLTQLVDDLLDISRIGRGMVELKTEVIEIRDFIQLAVETNQPLIDKGSQTFTMMLPPEPVWVEGDRIRLSQIVSNLINNAANYTKDKGQISLSVEASADKILIQVSDNGCGFDQSEAPNLFDIFYQTNRNLSRTQGGLGLGLSIVKNLVKMHGGDVQASSAGLGLGSTFIVRLPRLVNADTPAAVIPDQRLPNVGKLRFLLVEDNFDVADSLALLLRLDGHQVLIAYDGPTGLEIAKAEKPDVVLLDIGLPGMDGYSVAKALRQCGELDGMLIIAVTGYGQLNDKQMSVAAGFDEHLVKPFKYEILQKILKNPKMTIDPAT
jgi:PAS domain S-box-containing protein